MAMKFAPLKMPDYKPDVPGPHLFGFTDPTGFANSPVIAYGTLLATSDKRKNTLPLSTRAAEYPALFHEKTVLCLTAGGGGETNPIIRTPTRRWGTKNTVLGGPRTLLFSSLEDQTGGSGVGGDSGAFAEVAAAGLDKFNVLISNRTGSSDNSFGGSNAYGPQFFSALAEGLVFDGATTVGHPAGGMTAGLVNPQTFMAGWVYEIAATWPGQWVYLNGFLGTVSPCTALTDHYIAQNVAVFDRYERRRKVLLVCVQQTPTSDLETQSKNLVLSESARAAAALADHGFAGTVVLQSDSGGFDIRAAMQGLLGDALNFFKGN